MAVRETFSGFKAVGRLKDKDLTFESGKFDDGVGYNLVYGKFIISVDEGEYTCKVYMKDKFAGSEHKTNSKYADVASLQTCVLDTPIEVDIRTNRFDDYIHKKSGKLVTTDCLNVDRVKILNEVSDDEKFEGKIEGMITKCIPEFKNEEETGRLLVELTGVGYNEKALPHSLIVSKEDVDDFNGLYEVGSMSTFDVSIQTVSYGTKSTARTGGFGRKVEINNGYTKVEWLIVGGDDPYDEESVNNKGEKLYIDPKEIKTLLEERSVMLEQTLKEGKNKTPKSKGVQSFKAMTQPTDALPFDDNVNPFL